MAIAAKDIVPLNKVRAQLTALTADVRRGGEKIITKNGEAYLALIDARRLDYYHQLEEERIHLGLLTEAAAGLTDVAAGRTTTVAALRKKYQRARPAGR